MPISTHPHRVEQLEASVARLTRELAAAHRELEHLRHLDQWKTTFISAAAHDLRAPLSVILLGTRTLLAHAELGPVRTVVERIDDQVRRLEHMLTDLLDLDRYTRAGVRPQREPTHLPALVDRVASETGLGDDLRTCEVSPVIADVDPERTAQVLANLLRNARAHTPTGTPVHLQVSATQTHVTITVEDEGPGLPAALEGRLFDPFATHATHDADHGGTGLGLVLVRMFAELQGGTAEATDRPGGGARFVVRLPATTHTRLAEPIAVHPRTHPAGGRAVATAGA